MGNFSPGKKSLTGLNGVHADLVALVTRAIAQTVQDLAVHHGLRTIEEQKWLIAAGA